MAEIKINKDRLVRTFLDLVKINAKSKEERPVADYIVNYLTNLGMTVKEDETGKKIDGSSGNLICRIPGTVMTTPAIAFVSHMDTVVPCENVNPVVKEEVIYSESPTILGADDRAGISSMLELANVLIENRIPHGEVELIFTVAEEIGLLGASHFDFGLLRSKMAIVLDGHGTPGHIVNAAPTLKTYNITCHGKSAHAGVCPEQGISAIELSSYAISEMKLGRVDHETTANIGMISGGNAKNIIPDKVELDGEARSIDPKKLDDQIEHIKSCFDEAVKKYGGKYDIKVCEGFSGYRISEDQDILRFVKNAAERLELNPVLESSGGGTDANIFSGNGLSSLVISIGYEDMHSTEEHIAIRDLITTVRWLIEILWVINQDAWNQFQSQPISTD